VGNDRARSGQGCPSPSAQHARNLASPPEETASVRAVKVANFMLANRWEAKEHVFAVDAPVHGTNAALLFILAAPTKCYALRNALVNCQCRRPDPSTTGQEVPEPSGTDAQTSQTPPETEGHDSNKGSLEGFFRPTRLFPIRHSYSLPSSPLRLPHVMALQQALGNLQLHARHASPQGLWTTSHAGPTPSNVRLPEVPPSAPGHMMLPDARTLLPYACHA
jgi:hypothetical protein